MKKKRQTKVKNNLRMKRHRKRLKQTADLIMDVGVDGMMVSTAKGLK